MKAEIIIIGAGATGLMAARELAKNGKKAVILEAKNRIGGRIWPLPEEEFGFQAQGGAEFVHGPAPVTRLLVKEAGLTYVEIANDDGEMWSMYSVEPVKLQEIIPQKELLYDKLRELKEDIPIDLFLDKCFREEKYAAVRSSVIKMAENYDAADSHKISTFSLRDEWLGNEEWQQGKIKEGYGALLNFLESACLKLGVSINLNQEVARVDMNEGGVSVFCANRQKYDTEKIIITVSLPVLNQIKFNPAVPKIFSSVSKIGFGQVVKILLLFKDRWWINTLEKDLSKLRFLLSDEKVPVWWTQYPEPNTLLTGWIAGPKAEKLKNSSSDEILNLAITSLSHIFKVNESDLRSELIKSRVVNWPADPFVRGAYSYNMVGSETAYAELRKPVDNKIFFAGEALFSGLETATVEGALASGLEVARKILSQ